MIIDSIFKNYISFCNNVQLGNSKQLNILCSIFHTCELKVIFNRYQVNIFIVIHLKLNFFLSPNLLLILLILFVVPTTHLYSILTTSLLLSTQHVGTIVYFRCYYTINLVMVTFDLQSTSLSRQSGSLQTPCLTFYPSLFSISSLVTFIIRSSYDAITSTLIFRYTQIFDTSLIILSTLIILNQHQITTYSVSTCIVEHIVMTLVFYYSILLYSSEAKSNNSSGV